MTNFELVATTNSYLGQRKPGFKPNRQFDVYQKVISQSLTLKLSNERLMAEFNRVFDTCYNNWAHCQMYARRRCEVAGTFKDGTRYFSFDSVYYCTREIKEL